METYAADIRIGGRISHADANELYQVIELECVYESGGDATTHVRADRIYPAAGEPLHFYSPETPWGRFEQIEAFCLSIGLPFERWSSDGERVVFDGRECKTYQCDSAGETIITRQDIERLGLADMAAIYAYFAAANATPPAFTLAESDADPLREYAFDIKLLATVRLRATTEDEARARLNNHIQAATANFGAWDDGPDQGAPIIAEASVDGDADLVEIDGESVD